MSTDTSAVKAGIIDWATQVWEAAAACMLDRLRESGSRHRQTGEMDASGHFDLMTANDDGISGAVTFDAPQAEWTNTGTRPHEIRPVSAKVLVFEGGNGLTFAASVNHPGYAGSGWFDDTATDATWGECVETAAGGISMVV